MTYMSILVKGVSKKFKGKGKVIRALKEVNLEVGEGEIFALLGPNGSGKTTLINVLLTLLTPDQGEVRIFGKDPFSNREVFQHLNFIPADRPYPSLKVEEFMSCYARLYSTTKARAEFLLKKLELGRLRKAACWTLSTGEMTCLMLAKALLNEPKLLLIDEPTLGLDPRMKRVIERVLIELNRGGVTIFFATHDMPEAQRLSTEIAFMRDGIILGIERKEKVVKRYGNVENYWLELGG